MQTTKSFKTKRNLSVEQLDNRLLLAGDCAAAMDADGDLNITCDAEDNSIIVSQLGGNLTVQGQPGTTINGSPIPLILGPVDLDDLNIRMRGGDDFVSIAGIEADDVFVSLGKGDDTLLAAQLEVADDVTVRGGKGNDDIGLLAINAGDRVRVNAGRGDDTVSANLVTADKIRLRGRAGIDTLILGSVIGDLVETGFEETSDDEDDGPGLPPLPLL